VLLLGLTLEILSHADHLLEDVVPVGGLPGLWLISLYLLSDCAPEVVQLILNLSPLVVDLCHS
jgi:hypothetical protein